MPHRAFNRVPPRVSVYDTIVIMCHSEYTKCVWRDLVGRYPELVSLTQHFQSEGQSQRETPVADARTAEAPATFGFYLWTSEVLVRYLPL